MVDQDLLPQFVLEAAFNLPIEGVPGLPLIDEAADIEGIGLGFCLADGPVANESIHPGLALENGAADIECIHPENSSLSPRIDLTVDSTAVYATLPIEFTLSDRIALYHLRNEVVFSIGGTKDPAWSTLAIMLECGSHNPAVMHLLLAASLTELSWKYATYSIMRNDADRHYVVGKSILIQMISADEELDHLLVMISFWFWYLYHRRDPRKDRLAYLEMSNRMSEYFRKYNLDRILSSSTPRSPSSMQPGPARELDSRTSCLARLTSWLFWADAAACFQGDGGSLAQLLIRSSPEAMFKIYDRSKPRLMSYWGLKYPSEELTDDCENEPMLDLINLTWIVVQKINEELESGPLDLTKTDEFGKQIEDLLLGKYANIVGLAKSRNCPRDRRLGNADWAVSNLYALCIYLFRCSISHEADTPTLPPEVDEVARNPAYLIEIMDRSLDGSPMGQVDRFQWPLFWAGVETRDRVHQKWVREKLTSPVLNAALNTVLQEQSNTDLRIGIDRIREICHENCGGVRSTPW